MRGVDVCWGISFLALVKLLTVIEADGQKHFAHLHVLPDIWTYVNRGARDSSITPHQSLDLN